MFIVRKTFNLVFACVVLVMITSRATTASDQMMMSEIGVRNAVTVVEGGKAKLPCDITPSFPGDKMHIVIWFKESRNGSVSPVYSFDSRDSVLLEKGRHWSNETIFGGRAYFRYEDEPAELTIDDVLYADGGIYQCRVDFKQSPTRNSKVNLTVIIRPRNLNILDERGVEIVNHSLGPYNEGSSINITCIATEGTPTPKVTWWLENALLDDSCESSIGNKVKNVLYIERLQKRHDRVILTCQASNSDLVTPISNWIRIDLNLKPLSVRLLGENRPFSVGKSYQLECEVTGSRPAPRITWWKGGTSLNKTQEIKAGKDSVISTIHFTPSFNDQGKYISCCADHPLIPDSNIENGWKLNVFYAPIATLELGKKLERIIKEGDNVYFDCNVKANPWIYKISWKHNGEMLYNNPKSGIVITNQSLVLERVTKNFVGIYTCIGSSKEGDGESKPFKLDVNFSPNCRSKDPVTYKVALHQTVRLSCELEASPANVEFFWIFNDTEIPQHLVSVRETASTLFYTPRNQSDYGEILCKGENSIGNQKDPCIFQILPSDKPEPLSNCFLLNKTYRSVFVKCSESLADGTNQTYVAEVYNLKTRKLLQNLTSVKPIFLIDGLERDLRLEINLYGLNKNGPGDRTRLIHAFIQNLENLEEVLRPPENCSVTSQDRYGFRIKCQVSEIQRRKSLTYLLQVYDANSRTLVGTSTARSPDNIAFTNLPRNYQELLVFIRSIDENSLASDARMLYLPAAVKVKASGLIHRAQTQIQFHITPMLAITICVVVATLLLVVLGTLAINNLIRKRSGKFNKERKYSTATEDEEGTVKDEQEERNPDIIPLRRTISENDADSISEIVHSLPSASYLKMAGPEDIAGNCNMQPSFTTPHYQHQYCPQLPRIYPNPQMKINRNIKLKDFSIPGRFSNCRNFMPDTSSNSLYQRESLEDNLTEMPLLENYQEIVVTPKNLSVTEF